ncbi:DUF4347 domain-containing protein [Massilia atriviolacea]|uniref:DUF4347 domain-containing protein n=1 Tax=Massilia atriviolacea TaxID=2495579 RepID=A0A430HMB1_9BURK|nr:DUF4347 domain-containing protein [Massilia atriviolacea]RSZ58697.1 DUF4347 domain-containing protein [Massilia atriviolacea]
MITASGSIFSDDTTRQPMLRSAPAFPHDTALKLRIAAGEPAAAPALACAIGHLAAKQRSEVTFIESNVGDLRTLQQGLGAGAEVHILDAAQDGLQQIAAILAGRSGIDAVHIISHGATAAVNFGALQLDGATLDSRSQELQVIGASLAPDGDILLYGCDVAQGQDGAALIDRLAIATGADVAGSSNRTGSAAHGGDWNLEISSGKIDSRPVVDAALAALYSQVLVINASTLSFNTAANFINMGSAPDPAVDVVYKVSGNPAYQFKVDGHDRGVVFYNLPGKNYVVNDSATGAGESLITFSFVGGQLFTPTSMTISNYQPSDVSQNLVFKGYDASGTLVGTKQVTTAASTALTPFALNGLTEIATLKLTATTNGNKAIYLVFTDIVLNNIHLADATPPTVASVAVPSNGTYKTGDQLDFTVNFSEAVTVNTGGGTPSIAVTLDTGGTVQAQYLSGSGSSALVFRYVLASGNLDADGVALGGSLALNGGTLKDAAGNDATATLNSVGALSGVLVDAVAPAVTSINRTGAAVTSASSVDYAVTFSESVSGVGTSDFSLTKSGSANGNITGISGSGSSYTVTVSGVSGDGIMRLNLNGPSTGILDMAGNAIATTGYTSGQVYTLDHTGPAVGSVGVPGNATYTVGQPLAFTVNFNEAVSVTGTPRLAVLLDTGGTVYASYVSGSGSTALVLSYTVVNGNADANGVGLGALDLNGGTLKDAAGNNASLTLNNVGALSGVLVNAAAPEVSSITLVDAATTNQASVGYTVVFSTSVNNVDIGDFVLSGSASGNVASVTGSGSTYTVTVDSVTGNGSLRLDLKSAGTGIVDGASNPIAGGYTAGAAYTIDTGSPAVSSVAAPANGSYMAGSALDFTVNFNEAVFVNGAPALDVALDTGGTVAAQYVSGSGTSALLFRYSVGGGQTDADGPVLGADIALNGGALKDAAGNDATLALNGVASLAGVLIDTQAPELFQITRVGPRANNGSSVQYNVKFVESVSGVDIGDFSLFKAGTAAGSIASITGSGADYVVTINGVSGDGELRMDLKGSGTNIVDLAGNPIPNTPRIGNQSYMLDHTAPAVATVAVPSDATYGVGQALDFRVQFAEAVTVDSTGGTPRIAVTLATGGTAYAHYVSGSATASLLFRHIVASGTADSDGIALGAAIELNGGTLRDAAANPAALALNNVGALAGVLVNGLAPSVTSISRVQAATSKLSSVDYTVQFSSAVSNVDTGDFSLAGSGVSGTIASVSGSGASYTVTVNNIGGDGTLRLDLNSAGTGIIDGSGNPIAGGFTAGQVYSFDHTAPQVSSVSGPADATYAAGAALDFVVQFGEAVTVATGSGTPSIGVTLDTGGTVQAQYVSGSGGSALTFRYIVAGAHSDSNGVVLANAIALNGGTLQDAQGNDATLALNGIAALGGVKVDALAPAALSIVPAGPVRTRAASVDYTVTFSENVSGVDVGDFALATSGTASGAIASVSGSGSSYTVTVDTVAGDGLLQLNLKGGGTGIGDAAGNAILAGVSGQGYTIDHTAPGATLSMSSLNLGAGQTALVTIAFSEAVAGLDLGDLAAGGGTLSNLASSDNITWTATFTPAANTVAAANTITLGASGVTDLAGNPGSGSPASPAYAINTVALPPVPPVLPPVGVLPATAGRSTVDGVVLDTTVTYDAATGLSSSKVVIAAIETSRPDDPGTPNPTLADIPLGLNNGAGGVAVRLTVSLPDAVGLVADGASSLLNKQQALLDLIRRIEQKTTPGTDVQNAMKGLGQDFLGSLFDSVLLESMTITPQAAPGASGASTILISGSSTGLPEGSHHPGAIGLVIDASGLPANAVLQLDNVDFAAIVGNATLRGGDGQNFVIGDGASQNILLGADDDLLYGGAGDDIIGSAGGKDRLDGGSGNDRVVGGIGSDSLHGGSGNDVLQGGRSDSGAWQFWIERSGALTGSHQTALFAPGKSESVARAELNAAAPELAFLNAPQQKLLQLAGMYQAVFDRVADLPGLAFWAMDSGDLHTTATSFLTSKEWLDAGNGALSDLAFLTTLYRQGLGRAPDADGLAFWLAQLDGSGATGVHSRADVLLGFALGAELQARMDTARGVAVGQGVAGTEGDWIAGGGDDRLDGGSGSDLLVGGDGTDTVVYAGKLSDYKILLGADGKVRIADRANGDLDTLSGIELGNFGGVTVDLAFTQASGATLRSVGLLYQSVFDRPAGLNGINELLGRGSDTLQLAQVLTASEEFRARYAGTGDAQFVQALYRNADAGADAAQEGVWIDYLGTHTRAELVAAWIDASAAPQAQFGNNGLWLV